MALKEFSEFATIDIQESHSQRDQVMRIRLVTVVILLLVIAACGEKSPPKPDPTAAPPPPTPREVAQGIIADGHFDIAVPPRGRRLQPARVQHVKKTVDSAVRTHGATPEGKEALAIVSQEIEKQISATQGNELWDFVVMYCEAYETLQPGSPRYTTAKADAILELSKPVLSGIQIIADIEAGQTTILADVYLPLEGVTYRNEKLYVGDERPDLRLKLVRLVGDNQGVRVRYLETDDEWDVLRKP